ncbi:putative minor tail protein [Serratia phage vB_SmaS_Opt-169]|uniref:Putative minor tail protein n=1 Tax=Serratia phage vB_SmaS_Rovert TaxID=2777363 RepID=A0A7T3N9S8_9CAUD|nr:putative minor tail protein [Serratia phage vB_SmaS_Rovert]QPX74984.1 putative minor tail protein [Serratia phage vB_SmaS_Rovert]QPX75430.1 putative minor tail protein [Serratia phage vB_SmaS_Opt-169]UGO51957.1 putative minor tail protein [Serratia phage vB_SmaS_PhooPhighters]
MADLKTFSWPLSPGIPENSAPSVTVLKFTDGYEQRKSNTINDDLKSYTGSITINIDEAMRISEFLEYHGAIKAFNWYSETRKKKVKVVCRKWTRTENNTHAVFSLNFDEVMN